MRKLRMANIALYAFRHTKNRKYLVQAAKWLREHDTDAANSCEVCRGGHGTASLIGNHGPGKTRCLQSNLENMNADSYQNNSGGKKKCMVHKIS